jgi:hypothetical protein
VTDNTINETEELRSGPITPEEVKAWEDALTPQDKLQLRRLQLQQASIAGATPDKEPDWSRMGDGEFVRERMKRYGF